MICALCCRSLIFSAFSASYPRTECRVAERVGYGIAQRRIRKHLRHLGAGVSSTHDEDPLVLELLGLDQAVENAIGRFAFNAQLAWSATHTDCQHYITRFEAFAGTRCDFKLFAGSDLWK